jgi:4-diphosphocytidyl-2-C-methyl-D-erythritol kinase
MNLLLLNIILISSTSTIFSLIFKNKISNIANPKSSNLILKSSFIQNSEYELSLRSPCKINLFLRITGKRENGYHDLASLFQTISLSDYMHFSKLPSGSTKDELICSDPSLQIDDSNLVIKAMNLMRSKSSINDAYFKIKLDKIVPMQAGLGGGSGNAATAMHAFNKLTGFKSSLNDLINWSGDIGSDITFFFSTGTAYCTGRGEIIEPLPPIPHSNNVQVHIFKPQEGLSTKLVFQNLDIKTMCSNSNPLELRDLFMKLGPMKAASLGGLENDLEPPAFKCSPDLEKLKSSISQLFVKEPCLDEGCGIGEMVMMSGSGTSIYALSDSDSSDSKRVEIDKLISRHIGLKYHKCSFVNKINDVYSWYE